MNIIEQFETLSVIEQHKLLRTLSSSMGKRIDEFTKAHQHKYGSAPKFAVTRVNQITYVRLVTSFGMFQTEAENAKIAKELAVEEAVNYLQSK